MTLATTLLSVILSTHIAYYLTAMTYTLSVRTLLATQLPAIITEPCIIRSRRSYLGQLIIKDIRVFYYVLVSLRNNNIDLGEGCGMV